MLRPSTERAYVAGLAVAADLGELTAEPVVLKQGSVASWRVATTRGDFHVKRFAQGNWPWLRQSLAACAQVERAAQRAGVPLAEPVVLGMDVGHEIVNVHRWWRGRPVQPEDDIARWLGRTLATLHTLPSPSEATADALSSYYGLHPPDDWHAWFREGRSHGLTWAEGDEALAGVARATEIIADGLATESRRAGTHRDLLGPNILTDGAELVLIDWDCAGPDVPWFEAVRAAVEFGRLAATVHGAKPLQPDPRVSRAILAAYAEAGGHRGVGGQRAFAGVLGMMLWRLAFAVWVSLGHRPGTSEERAESTTYVSGALAKLRDRMQTLDTTVRSIGL